MLTLLGSLLGFASSAVPQVIDIFKEKKKQEQDLEIMKLQISAKKEGVELDILKMEKKNEIEEQARLLAHDSSMEADGFINGLRAFVRPFITYVFFLAFIGVKVVMVWHVLNTGGDLVSAIETVWDDETEALFAAVMSFWFGSRAMPQLTSRKGTKK